MRNIEASMQSTGRFTTELRKLMARSYDACQSCRSSLPRDVAAYAGYAADGAPLYVGMCCASQIAELASHIYWWWEADKRCAPDLVLWRYMDFAKFVGIHEQRALWFSRADMLGDRFEGAAGIEERRSEWDEFYLDFFRKSYLTLPGQTEPPPRGLVEREAHRLLGELRQIGEIERQQSYVSCWHANAGESEALWRLYCPPPTSGVAVRTTVDALTTSLGDNAHIRVGRVQYTDFRQSFAGFHDRIFWKRKSLAHEVEVRAVIRDRNRVDASGILVPVSLDDLLVDVVPSPFAPSWFPSLLAATMKRFGYTKEVGRSELLSEPFY